MASLLRRRIVRVYPRSVQRLLYSTSVQASGATKEEATSPTGSSHDVKPSIPMVPKRRDPDAVLKALASTVEPVEIPLYMRGRGIADPLYPRGRGYHMVYTKHLEAGRAAAESIVQKWPKLFPSKPTDPTPANEGLGKSPLECLIIERDATKAWSMYETMKEEGEEVPLSVENELLALVAYHGLGNTRATSPDESDIYVHWPRNTAGSQPPSRANTTKAPVDASTGTRTQAITAEDVEGSEVDEEIGRDADEATKVSVWSTDNTAECMFREMKKKDGGTYEALIQGLIKFNRYGRAFDIFQEMRDKNFQANVGIYNLLLSALKGYRVFNIATSLVKNMVSRPIIQPNITTMNHLLRISSKLEGSTKSISLKIMRELLHLGLEPTLTTFVNLLVAHSSDRYGSTNEERAVILEQVVSYIESNKQMMTLTEETDAVFFIQAFMTARKIGSTDLAMRLKSLAAVHGNFLVDNINYVMGLYLSTLCHNTPIETTMAEYHSLVPKVTVPLEWVYRDMFEMCDRHKSAEMALQLWKHTKRFMVPLTQVNTLNRLCGALTHTIPQEDLHSYLEALNEVWEIFKNSGNNPSELLITAMVRAHAQDNNLDEAWRYFKHFDKPSFLALVTLLKKYNSLEDKKKTLEILEIMVELDMTMPQRFVRDIVLNAGASEETRDRLVNRLANMKETEGEEEVSNKEATDKAEPFDS